jgi:hypothetical protein
MARPIRRPGHGAGHAARRHLPAPRRSPKPRPIPLVGVFRNEKPMQVAYSARALGLHAVQLHGEEDARLHRALRGLLPEGTEIWAAAAVGRELPEPRPAPTGPCSTPGRRPLRRHRHRLRLVPVEGRATCPAASRRRPQALQCPRRRRGSAPCARRRLGRRGAPGRKDPASSPPSSRHAPERPLRRFGGAYVPRSWCPRSSSSRRRSSMRRRIRPSRPSSASCSPIMPAGRRR